MQIRPLIFKDFSTDVLDLSVDISMLGIRAAFVASRIDSVTVLEFEINLQ